MVLGVGGGEGVVILGVVLGLSVDDVVVILAVVAVVKRLERI